MARRLAVLIGNGKFIDPQNFPDLDSPARDATDLAEALQKLGDFEILKLLIDKDANVIRTAIEDLFCRQAQKGDLALLYYSGHGHKEGNDLYFIASNTTRDLIGTTSVEDITIQRSLQRSNCKHRIIILDACFSGSFNPEKKAGQEPLDFEFLTGEATAVLASSGRTQVSYENKGQNSVFTQCLLNGILTGEADLDRDGLIKIHDLSKYLGGSVKNASREKNPSREQTPMLHFDERDCDIWLTKTPPEYLERLQVQRQKEVEAGYEKIRQSIQTALDAYLPNIRLGAVNDLADLLSGSDPELAQWARARLEDLTHDDSRIVEQAARAALQTKPAEILQPDMKIEIPLKPAAPSVEKPVEPQAGATRMREKDDAVMVYVPAGEFLMGSGDKDKDASDDEKPQHKVFLDGFWIDRTPVTNTMYRKAVEAGACTKPHDTQHYDDPKYADHPVVYMDWNQAQAYCQWVGGILPSEAQWEKAARGTDGRIYPWGNQAPDKDLLNYNMNIGDTTPVGKYPKGASLYGVLDMAGNVWEWVNDWYAENYYKNSPGRNPTGPEKGDYRVLRGGAFFYLQVSPRCAYRYGFNPIDGSDFYGFRPAVVL